MDPTNHPAIDASAKLTESIRTTMAAMDDLLFQIENNKSYMVRAAQTESNLLEAVNAAAEEEKLAFVNQANSSLMGISQLMAVMDKLQAKASEVFKQGGEYQAMLMEASDLMAQAVEPICIESIMKEEGITEEEARALLQAPLTPDAEAEIHSQAQRGARQILRNQ